MLKEGGMRDSWIDGADASRVCCWLLHTGCFCLMRGSCPVEHVWDRCTSAQHTYTRYAGEPKNSTSTPQSPHFYTPFPPVM